MTSTISRGVGIGVVGAVVDGTGVVVEFAVEHGEPFGIGDESAAVGVVAFYIGDVG